MATLTVQQRGEVHAALMGEASNDREVISLTKVQLLAALVAADDWLDTNAAAFNSALPVAARVGLTARQKARLLMAVAQRRFREG